MKASKSPAIDCPIALFPRQEEEIQRLTQMVNEAPSAEEKLPHAESLEDAVNVLLACAEFNEIRLNCQLCRQISQLRLSTFRLVIKAGRLDQHRRHSSG